MKLLVAGDIHGDRIAAKYLAQKAKNDNVDLVVLSGDITLFGKHHEGIIGYFLSHQLKTVLIHGNHEDESFADFLSELYGITNMHGKSRVYDNIGVFACGGANIGPDAMSEKQIYDTLVKAHASLMQQDENIEKKIMVTHVHPSDTKIAKLSKFVKGSSGVRRAIEKLKPDLVFCSHVHEAQGLEDTIAESKVFCVGKNSKTFDL